MELEKATKRWLEVTRHWLDLKKTGTQLIADDVTRQFEGKSLALEKHLKELSKWLAINVSFIKFISFCLGEIVIRLVLPLFLFLLSVNILSYITKFVLLLLLLYYDLKNVSGFLLIHCFIFLLCVPGYERSFKADTICRQTLGQSV